LERQRIAVDRGLRGGDRKAPITVVIEPLRVGVDARELVGEATGVGRYLGELLLRWTARSDAARRRFVLYSPEALPSSFPPDTTEIRMVGAGAGRGTWWEQIHLRRAVRSDPLDVFFAPAYTAPLGTPVPLAVTIHDISFVAHPEWFRAREGLRRRWLTRRTAQSAAVVFTDSQFSRAELETRLHVAPARIVVIAPGVTDRAGDAADRAAREPIVLFAGSLFNRRRLPDLIAAFAMATTDLPGARLVIVGGDRTWPRQDLASVAAEHGVEGRTEFRRYVPDRELGELYRRASAFAFLSEYEGFGMTPLEALSAGVPPIVLDTAVAREVYGDAAIFVARGDIRGTAAALRRLLTEPSSAAPILASAQAVLGRYSWAAAADRTLEHIERIARR
jgi:glycosyltransferase involved in cell wall biosynthesis